jgi:peroxiredoxin
MYFCLKKGGAHMTRKGTLVLALAIAAALLAYHAAGAKEIIGHAAPNWSGIVGVDDQLHSLADYKNAKLIVLVFTCNHCPVAVAYEDRLIALQKDYKDKGVQVIAVNVNNIAADKLDKMKERAASKNFNFPYLYDATQKIGIDYGALVTPHVFILDPQRKVVYVGAVDDKQKVAEVKQPYVRDALDALLSGKEPPKAETKPFGCGIRYEK